MKGAFHAFVAILLLASTARAGPEFRVSTGLLMLFDGGRKTPIRYKTQTDLNFEEGGSVRVFSTVTPEGLAEVEVLARSKVDFYFLGADVSLAPSGTIRATVEDIKHPQIKLTWDGGTASPSKVLQTPEELLSYFIVLQPPVFSKSPIADDDLSKIYPQNGQSSDQDRSGPNDSKDAVEVDFPFASPSPPKDQGPNSAKPSPTPTTSPRPKPSPSPRARPCPSQKDSDKALLAETAHSPPCQSPTPNQKTAPANSRPTPEASAEPSQSPSPDLMPDLPTTASDSPSPSPAHILKSLLPGPAPAATPAVLTGTERKCPPSAVKGPQRAENFAKEQVDPLNLTAAEPPKAMPEMHAPIANLTPEFLPLLRPAAPGPNSSPNPKRALPKQAGESRKDEPLSPVNIERPDIVLGGQKEFTPVLRALPVDKDPGLRNGDAPLEAQKPPRNVPEPVVLNRELLTAQAPEPQPTPFVISSAITKKNPPRQVAQKPNL